MSNRYEIIEAVKGIGMISVIIGHSAMVLPLTHIRIGNYVYLYHLMIFFFTTGFLYNERYNDKIGIYIRKRALSLLKPFVIYNTIFVLFHNTLKGASIITGNSYGLKHTVFWIGTGFIMLTNESMLGAFWFLPVLLAACILFCLTFWFVHKVSQALHGSETLENVLSAVIMLIYAMLGIYINYTGKNFTYHIQTSILAIPVMYVAFVVKKYMSVIDKIICLPGCILSFLALCGIVHFEVMTVELSANNIGNIWLFYPVTLLGVYFCLCLSKVMMNISPIHSTLTFIGRYSLHFMALHFIVFKLTDRVISLVKGDPGTVASVFPHSYELGLIYTFVAVAIISAGICIAKIVRKMLTVPGT